MSKERYQRREILVQTERKVFCINEDVVLAEGAKRAAIYNFKDGNVYSINRSAGDIVLEKRTETKFYEELAGMGLVSANFLAQEYERPDHKLGLEFMWLELTSQCNLACLHCYRESSAKVHDIGKVPMQIWETVIRQGAELGCRHLQFIGGEPLLFEKIFDLASCAKAFGYEYIEIFTNGTLLDPVKIRQVKDLGIKLAVSLYSDDASVHDKVTRSKGSFGKTSEALLLLKEAEIPVRIGVVVMKQNESTIQGTLEMIKDLGFEGGDSVDVVRAIGRGKKKRLLPSPETCHDFGTMTRPIFYTGKNDFERNLSGNPCWLGKIAVASDGNIIPCVTARDQIVGRVEAELGEVIEGKPLRNLWEINKDKISVCADCEYRYACGDCRPLAKVESRTLYGKTSRCTYDPFSGEW